MKESVYVERASERAGEGREGRLYAANHRAIGLIRLDVDTIARDEGREISACHRQGCFLVTLHSALANPRLTLSMEFPRSKKIKSARECMSVRFFFFTERECKAAHPRVLIETTLRMTPEVGGIGYR